MQKVAQKRIAVFGSRVGSGEEELIRNAALVGQCIAEKNAVLIGEHKGLSLEAVLAAEDSGGVTGNTLAGLTKCAAAIFLDGGDEALGLFREACQAGAEFRIVAIIVPKHQDEATQDEVRQIIQACQKPIAKNPELLWGDDPAELVSGLLSKFKR